jgi:hypothetical protein
VPVKWETDEQRLERCDHDGTTDASTAISVCMECGKT